MVGERLFGRDRVCGVVAAADCRAAKSQFRRGLSLGQTLELRLDWFPNLVEVQRFLAWLRRRSFHATLIATCRRRVAGGHFRGGISSQLRILRQAVEAGCAWCDVEMETAERLRPGTLHRALPGVRILISFHDFRRTPRDLYALARGLVRWGGDAIKIAAHCRTISDSVRMLDLAQHTRDAVVVPMGETGLPARILSLREGSALTYAAIDQSTASGQPSLEQMNRLYRAGSLTSKTKVYGIVGNPVGHSLSPLLHNMGFRVTRQNAVYLPFLVTNLGDFLIHVKRLRLAGFSVTVPHKQHILRHLNRCDSLAKRIGAANTVVVRPDGRLSGSNTDFGGVIEAVRRSGLRLRNCRVLIIGSGGAARAAAFALAHAGARVFVSARRPRQATRLARAVGGESIPRSRVRLHSFDLIVNATPVGMYPRANQSPMVPGELNCRAVLDLIYRPLQTKLLKLARSRRIKEISGVEMFLAQGIAQWELWMGRRAPRAHMRHAVLSALNSEERASGKR